jgi:hypothetical protein
MSVPRVRAARISKPGSRRGSADGASRRCPHRQRSDDKSTAGRPRPRGRWPPQGPRRRAPPAARARASSPARPSTAPRIASRWMKRRRRGHPEWRPVSHHGPSAVSQEPTPAGSRRRARGPGPAGHDSPASRDARLETGMIGPGVGGRSGIRRLLAGWTPRFHERGSSTSARAGRVRHWSRRLAPRQWPRQAGSARVTRRG